VGKNTTLLGGQAVLEGVMMRFGGSVATAVRRADGSIDIKKETYVPLAERHRWIGIPLIRGAVGLIEMLAIGIRALNFSAEAAMQDEVGKDGQGKKHEAALGVTMAIALLAGVGLFFALPLWIATAAFSVDQEPFSFNLAAGGIRVAIFLGYIVLLSMMKDIYRLFQYHGAEHKTVFAMEKGLEMTPASCRVQSQFHPRCGTSFLLVVMVVAILFFALLDAFLIWQLGALSLPLRLATHLPLIPLVMGLSYEVIRFSARHVDTMLGRWIVLPGLWLQRVTTKEPDDAQIEVALAALKAALDEAPASPAVEQVPVSSISVN